MRGLALLALCACGRLRFEAHGTYGDDDDATLGDGAGDGTHPDVAFVNNIAFVSSATIVLGALGDAAGADAACQTEAGAAGLPGNYVAWVSTSASSAVSRLGNARGWMRVDGVPFVDQISDLTASRIMSPLAIGSDGVMIPVASGAQIATGTVATGTADTNTCSDLTSQAAMINSGTATATSTRWSSWIINVLPCNTGERIYCLGTSSSKQVSVPHVASRRAFISTVWVPGGGLASADMQCQTDANNAGLTSATSFRALLATGTASAASRFVDGLPWARLDGVLLAPTAQDVFNYNWQVTLNVDATGAYLTNISNSAWVGANTLLISNSTNTCSNWTVSNNGSYGVCPDWDVIRSSNANCPCGSALRLYCLEQ